MAGDSRRIMMEPRRLSEERKERLEKTIEKILKKHRIRGASVAVTDKKGPIYERYFGTVRADGEKNGPEKMMMIGSNTKPLTALAILTLKDKGLLDLDADIRTYLEDFAMKSRFGDVTVTVRDLLMHIGGIPDDLGLIIDKEKKLPDTIDALREDFFTERPQTMYAYSNPGYGLLGLIIEKVSGQSYEDHLQKAVLDPLGLSLRILDSKESRKAMRDRISASFDKKENEHEDPLTTLTAAGSSTYATLFDMIRLARFFLDYENQSLLQKETMAEMLERPASDHVICESETIGLGLRHDYIRFYDENVGKVLGHGGNTVYHHSTFDILMDQGLGFIVMNNTEKGAMACQKISRELMSAFLAERGLDVPKRPKEEEKGEPVFAEDRTKTYFAPGYRLPFQEDRKGYLILKMGPLRARLHHAKDGFLTPVPKGIARLPLLRSAFKRLRFKPASIKGHDVLFVEILQEFGSLCTLFAGADDEKAKIPDTFLKACGDYTPVAQSPAAGLVKQAKLEVKKGVLTFSMKFFEERMTYSLRALDEKEAIIMGFGRGARETVTLHEDDDGRFILRIKGLQMTRKDA